MLEAVWVLGRIEQAILMLCCFAKLRFVEVDSGDCFGSGRVWPLMEIIKRYVCRRPYHSTMDLLTTY
jgi:hypothetical protein